MAIELIQKQTSRERGIGAIKLKSWLSLLIGVLILSLICYGGLFGYKKYLERNLNELNNQIIKVSQRRDLNVEERVKTLDKQIRDIRSILKNRLYWSRVFAAIEELTLPQLYFSSFNGAIDETGIGTVSFESDTVNFSEAAKELQLFKDGSFFKNIQANNLQVDESRSIKFSLSAEFDLNNLKD